MKPQKTLHVTREEIIDDFSETFIKLYDLSKINNNNLVKMWLKHGIHTETGYWDNIEVIKG